MPRHPRTIPIEPDATGRLSDILDVRQFEGRDVGGRPSTGERGMSVLPREGLPGPSATKIVDLPQPKLPELPSVSIPGLGDPLTINLPGSSIELPITRGVFGIPRLLLPKIVLSRGAGLPGLKSPNPLVDCMKEENRAICLLNAAVNAAILLASRIRVPAGTVIFAPGKLPRLPLKLPSIVPRRTIPKRPASKPATIVQPPLRPARPSGPFKRDRPFERSKPAKRGRRPEEPTRIPPILIGEKGEIGDFPGAAPPPPAEVAPKISPEILTSPQTEPQTAAERAVLPQAGTSVSTTTAAATRPIFGRRSASAGGSLLPFLLRSAAASVPGLFFGRGTSFAQAIAPATAPALAPALPITPPVTVATALPGRFVGGSRAPTRAARECQEVKRRRRRKGKCREGFFEELPGRTRYTTWRTVNCATGKTIREFS